MIQQDMNLAQRKAEIARKLEATGEKERLKEELRNELRLEGWHDKVNKYCNDLIATKSLDEISNNHLIEEIRPFAKVQVPENVKDRLLQKIKSFIEESKEQ